MKRDDEIFSEALDLSGSARVAFLESTCGADPARRARIEALLAGHEASASFLEKPLTDRPLMAADAKPGDVIGRYTLLSKIGEGGCGVVYLAEQKEPVRRRVALKIIKLGMDTHSVILRFEAERQALAMMNHPDIARVFDAGATETGRPFFVMEFVDGMPIAKFCDEHQLSIAARLNLFIRVCLAVQHAHQKGIIHRDLKSSNILVAFHDGVAAPQVIDFGIAKATQGRLTEHTLLTGVDQFIGTPATMSPEQAEQRDLDIDTRSDVYSLGVLLYELLAGRAPFDPRSLMNVSVDEIRRIIREVEPARPSLRVTALSAEERATIASQRQVTSSQLISALRGDLDWIVVRCLEKDRDRRYSTALELAEDLRRSVRNEPVLARPPQTIYRVRKFVARNRLACASAAMIVLTLIVSTVVSVRQAVRATRAERVAQAERDTANAASRAEALASADAQRRQEQAEDLLTFMVGDYQTELQKVGQLHLLDVVGEKVMAYFAALDPRDRTDIALARQAKALTQIGQTRMDQARYPEATAAFSNAYKSTAALAARHPKNGEMLFERAQAEYWLGFVARKRGDFATEREWFIRYRDSAIALVAIEGKNLRAQRELTSGYHNLAVLEIDHGNLADARSGFLAEKVAVAEMLAANPSEVTLQFRMADVASWLGSVAERDGNYGEAIERFTEMSACIETLVALEPEVARWRLRLVDSMKLVGLMRALTGRKSDAIALLGKAQGLMESLVAQDPKNQQWLLKALDARLQQVALLLAEGETSTATQILMGTRDRLEALVKAEPSARVFTIHLAVAWRLEGCLRFAAGRPDAIEAVARALDLSETLRRESRADRFGRWEFAQSNILAGRIAQAQGQPEVARRHWQRVLEELGPRLANSRDWMLLDPAAQALALLEKAEDAQPLIKRLQSFGYHPIDLSATSILNAASLPVSSTPNR